MLAIHVALSFVFLASCFSGTATQTVEAQFIDYRPGDFNMIITAPHGGSEKPSDIKDRTAGCYNAETKTCTYRHDCTPDEAKCGGVTLGQDVNTYKFAEMIRANVYNLTGRYPYLIASRLHRAKLELNRAIDAAAFGNPVAEANYNYYHNLIEQTKAEIDQTGLYNSLLIVDLHRHVHSHNLTELGYGISIKNLEAGTYFLENSTLRFAAKKTGYTNALITGNLSLGYLFEQLSIACLPSSVNPTINGRNYFNGGLTVRMHSSEIHDAVQIEFAPVFRSKDIEGIMKNFASALTTFMKMHYSMKPQVNGS